jgi:hypothetical protein
MAGRHSPLLALAGVLSVAVLVSSCASPANPAAMEVSTPRVQLKKNDYSVNVSVTGGQETDALSSSNISNADLKAAIEASLTKSGAFQRIQAAPDAQYELTARIIELSKPSLGFSFTVELEIGWSLLRTRDKAVLIRKAIRSTHTTGMSESFAGVTRLRMAVEGAVRKNIDLFIQEVTGSEY